MGKHVPPSISELQHEVSDLGAVYEMFVNPKDELMESVDYAHELGYDEGNHMSDGDDASDGLSTRGFEKSILESDGILGIGDHEERFLLVERGNGHGRGKVVPRPFGLGFCWEMDLGRQGFNLDFNM
ncbi:hypothetical protein CC2G_014745 [Coprinopsis cinerea AmutBmut pab1-1]|nr:hypothetical protein CC2G_014745 [Coprinopsis cinerea AmutBmut pab1-1]